MPFGQTGNPSHFLPLMMFLFFVFATNSPHRPNIQATLSNSSCPLDRHKSRQFTNMSERVNMSSAGVTFLPSWLTGWLPG